MAAEWGSSKAAFGRPCEAVGRLRSASLRGELLFELGEPVGQFIRLDCLGDAANCRAQRSSLAGGYAAVCDCRREPRLRRPSRRGTDLGERDLNGPVPPGATSRSRTILIAVRSPAFASSTAFCEMVTASASMTAKAAKVDLLSEPLGLPFGFGQTPLANVPSLFRPVFSGCCAASGCDTVTLPIMPEPMKPLAAN